MTWCRFDRVAGIVQIMATVVYLVGFLTNNWAIDSEGTITAGLFQTCTDDLCYETHVYYDDKSQKGPIIASAVLEIFALAGMIFVLVLMLFYLCGLFEEKSVGRGAAIASYISGILGIVGAILYGTTLSTLSFSLGWSFGLAVTGLIINVIAGIFINIGSEAYVEKQALMPMLKPGRQRLVQGQGRRRPRQVN